jgi:hypothetical protein
MDGWTYGHITSLRPECRFPAAGWTLQALSPDLGLRRNRSVRPCQFAIHGAGSRHPAGDDGEGGLRGGSEQVRFVVGHGAELVSLPFHLLYSSGESELKHAGRTRSWTTRRQLSLDLLKNGGNASVGPRCLLSQFPLRRLPRHPPMRAGTTSFSNRLASTHVIHALARPAAQSIEGQGARDRLVTHDHIIKDALP